METTKLSSKGQVIIPKPVRSTRGWKPGMELAVIEVEGGILLRPISPFERTDIGDVASVLEYDGKAKSLEEMDAAIRAGVSERGDGRR